MRQTPTLACTIAKPPGAHAGTSGICAEYKIKGMIKWHNCEESADFSKRQFVPLPDTESGDILRLL